MIGPCDGGAGPMSESRERTYEVLLSGYKSKLFREVGVGFRDGCRSTDANLRLRPKDSLLSKGVTFNGSNSSRDRRSLPIICGVRLKHMQGHVIETVRCNLTTQ